MASDATIAARVRSTIWFGISLLRYQQRVVVCHQLPAPFSLYPYSGEAIVAGNGFAFVLPNHGRAASLHRCVSIDAPSHVVGRDGLKSQTPRRKICNHLRLCSLGAAWAYADEILSVE